MLLYQLIQPMSGRLVLPHPSFTRFALPETEDLTLPMHDFPCELGMFNASSCSEALGCHWGELQKGREAAKLKMADGLGWVGLMVVKGW